jgi:hypothetical protein
MKKLKKKVKEKKKKKITIHLNNETPQNRQSSNG